MEEKFIVKNLELSFYGNKDDRTDCKIESLQWVFNLTMTNWGIASMRASVPEQEINFIYDLYNEDTDSYEQKEEKVQVSNIKVNIGKHNFINDLCPQSAEYNVQTKVLEVTFNNESND